MYPAFRLPHAHRNAPRLFMRCLLAVLVGVGWCLGGPVAQAQVSVLTQHNDNARTGANLNETILSPTSIKSANFGKLFSRQMDANVNGQVLYVSNVTIQGQQHNVLYAYTSNNVNNSPCSIYAFDADDPNASTPLWRHQLTNSAQWTTCAPVIDAAAKTMYVLTKDNNDNGPTKLRAFDITTGAEKTGSPITIAASVPGTGDGSVNGVVSFDTSHANCRPALLLANGMVYFAFAHNTDSFPYHGWIFGYSYDQDHFTQRAVFCTLPNGGDGGVWQAGTGLSTDAAGNVYCTVGNGTFDVPSGGIDYGMCVLKLSPSLSVLDWFAPYDERADSDADYDLGNIGVVGIPGTTRMFVGGTKSGTTFLLDSNNLGHFTPNGPDNVVQRFDNLMSVNDVGQSAVVWDTGATKYVYDWPRTANLLQFNYDSGVGAFSPAGVYRQTPNSHGGGSLALTANGSTGGILWAVGSNAVIHAYDATDVTKPELWNSTTNAARDGLPSVGHFEFPTVANGKLYVPTGNGQIAVYGLLQNTSTVYQINSGGDLIGTFAADTDFTGGGPYSVSTNVDTVGVTNAAPAAIYQSLRFGDFTYSLPNLTPGATYTVRLHFAELYFTTSDQRTFNVAINGTSALTNFDIVAAVGPAKALVKDFTAVADSNGKITLTFTSIKNYAQVNGIELLSGTGGGTGVPSAPTGLTATAGNAQVTLNWNAVSGATSYKVYRSTTSGSGYAVVGTPTANSGVDTGLTNGTTYYYVVTAVNASGESGFSSEVSATPSAAIYQINSGGGATGTFTADSFFANGALYSTGQTIDTSAPNAAPMAVYQTLRYGPNFSYAMTGLTPGTTYTVRLHFAEIYFTTTGKRIFNVAINGANVLSGFDIVAAAGAANKAVVKDFTAIADTNGKITLVLSATVDNAQINGIEILH